MSLLRRRAAHRSCRIHGDNGCELQGEAGPRTRVLDKRDWQADDDVRQYVSRLWAADWDCPEDEVYDRD
jgi:hypothetical protein